APAALEFRYGPSGKPALASPALAFNLSHSHERLLIAVAVEALGVDLERIRESAPIARLGAAYLHPAEQARMARGPAATTHRTFFRLWTCKEAYVKAIGESVFRVLGDIDVSAALDRAGSHACVRGTADTRFTLRDVPAEPGYVAALAAGTRVVRVRGWR